MKDGQLLLRQSIPLIRSKDFFQSLVQTSRTKKWAFSGDLNGWEGLSLVEIVQLEKFGKKKAKGSDKMELWKVASDDRATEIVWKAGDKKAPSFQGKHTDFMKVLVRAPYYTEGGYSINNSGSVIYLSKFESPHLQVAHGEKIMGAIAQKYVNELPIAVSVHHLVHRYVRKKPETEIQKHIYHSACFVEWNHGKYGMVFELAFKYGLGGFDGRSNWIIQAEHSKFVNAMAPQLKTPWKSELAEVRMLEVDYKNKDELLEFMEKYNEDCVEDKRFIDPKVCASAACGDRGMTIKDIARGCLNYVTADKRYNSDLADSHRSCQTFSTDFYQYLSGDDTAKPYSPFLHKYYVSTRNLFDQAP